MSLPPSVNVISKDYAYGLCHSRALVASVLKAAGSRVGVVKVRNLHRTDGPHPERPKFFRLPQFLLQLEHWRRGPRDLNIFLETFYPRFYPLARRQLFIPNQEWFFERDLVHLKQAEMVICKTRHAEEIFSRLGCRTAYASFTSRDRRRRRTEPMRPEFLCLTGERISIRNRVLALWARHPEWPRLTISSQSSMPEVAAPNLRQIGHFLSDNKIAQLQNQHQFHLCVTRAEGFGHKLNEGMSCGAIVLATDGPPMNELITPERGMLVKYASCEPIGLGTAFDFDEADLERTIEKCVRLSALEIEQLSLQARKWFEENDRFFRDRLPRILRELA